MMLSVDFFQISFVEMHVDLGGGDIRMAQHQLYRSQISASLEKMCGERMAKCMGGKLFI